MINIYTGPAIASVMTGHALDHTAQIIRAQHLASWRTGGLTGTVMPVSNWNPVAMLVSEIRRSEGELVLVTNRSEFENRPQGSFAILLSVEGYHTFAGDFEALHLMAELGITAFTFSHNIQNLLCTGCNERSGQGGFSHRGKA